MIFLICLKQDFDKKIFEEFPLKKTTTNPYIYSQIKIQQKGKEGDK